MKETIQNNLKVLQNSRRYNSKDMAKVMGKTYVTYLSRYEHPENFTIDEISRICKHFDVDLAKFISSNLKLTIC